ncbi:MAG: hypothetical protein EXS58_15430, partial [Candidatus Latescibacteria bacterium]|nr:hypothetical protein [Candidatus Latescibacterota bacterium]
LGFMEGLNNKIRAIQRRAYGIKDQRYLMLKVLTSFIPDPSKSPKSPVEKIVEPFFAAASISRARSPPRKVLERRYHLPGSMVGWDHTGAGADACQRVNSTSRAAQKTGRRGSFIGYLSPLTSPKSWGGDFNAGTTITRAFQIMAQGRDRDWGQVGWPVRGVEDRKPGRSADRPGFF